jgi:Ankyrin repeats (3 copies)
MSRVPRNDRFNDEEFEAEVQYSSSRFAQQENAYDSNFIEHEQTTLVSGDYSAIPGILQLNHLCANASSPADLSKEAKMEAEESWEPVREWLRSHSADEVRQAAEQRGDSSMTALHFACRNQPPIDVIHVFLSIALETVQWPDTFGWLPIHYACACGAQTEVIKALADVFPESKTSVDRRGRTPLHFALGNGNQNVGKLASPAVVAILSSSGAAAYADDNGMLVSFCKEQ